MSDIRKALLTPIKDLSFSRRVHNTFGSLGWRIIADIVINEECEMLKYKNFGRSSLYETINVLHNLGLHFGMDADYVNSIIHGDNKSLESADVISKIINMILNSGLTNFQLSINGLSISISVKEEQNKTLQEKMVDAINSLPKIDGL